MFSTAFRQVHQHVCSVIPTCGAEAILRAARRQREWWSMIWHHRSDCKRENESAN
jgi:hypothetical protein